MCLTALQRQVGVAKLYTAFKVENEAHPPQPNFQQLVNTLQDTCKLNVLTISAHQIVGKSI